MQRESVDKRKTTRKRTSPSVEEENDGAAGLLPDLLRRGLTLGFTKNVKMSSQKNSLTNLEVLLHL